MQSEVKKNKKKNQPIPKVSLSNADIIKKMKKRKNG